MAYFRKASKNKQVSIQKVENYSQTEMTFNELEMNILKERIQILEIENDKLRKENATLKKHLKAFNDLKDKTSVSSSPLSQNVPLFNSKLKGCNCKGNCANKICGCMKKDLQCSESCKCNANLCQNKLQERNKENYGTEGYALPSQKEGQKNFIISEYLVPVDKQPLESVSSVDEVFYDASEPDYENMTINLDAVRKLTFNTDEDTPEKDAVQLSAIQENVDINSQPVPQIEEEKIERRKKSVNSNKVKKDRKGSSSSQVGGKKNIEDPKLSTKSRKKSYSSKDNATNPKKERKGSKSKRTASVEIEIAEEAKEELLKNPKVNSRPRRNKASVRSEDDEDEKQVKTQDPGKVKTKSRKDVSESVNLKSIKVAGLASSRDSVSKLKQPKERKKLNSSDSVEIIEDTAGKETLNKEVAEKETTNTEEAGKEITNIEAAEKETTKNTRSKRNHENSFKSIVNRVTRALSNEEISPKGVQSRVRRLKRSVSSGSVACETGKTTQKKQSLPKTKNISKNISTLGKRTLNRSLSSDTLSKKPLRRLMSKVSLSFRKSKSVNIEEKTPNSSQLEESLHFNLSPVKESPKSSKEPMASQEKEEKGLKFDPMQPTRQLSRSPVPATTIVVSPEFDERYSLPLYRRYLNSQEIKIASPPPEILQDLCEEEVDLQTFQLKLAACRKCNRKFFPHRIELHEAVCQNV